MPGELFITGPGVARGYIGRPDLTAAAFLPNPFCMPGDSDAYARMYRTGDNVMWQANGIQRCACCAELSPFGKAEPIGGAPVTRRCARCCTCKTGIGVNQWTVRLCCFVLRCRFFGRKDGQVQLRGFRMELGEIEAVLSAAHGVQSAAVVLQVLTCCQSSVC